MHKSTVLLRAPAHRPAWFKTTPDIRMDVREAASGDSFLLAVMDGLEDLQPGRVLSIRTDFEPTLLYSIFRETGFEYWPERGVTGDWEIQVRRRRKT